MLISMYQKLKSEGYIKLKKVIKQIKNTIKYLEVI